MKRILVYEYLSGGGLMPVGEAASDELLALGTSMRDAIVADLLALEVYAVTVATCALASPVPAPALPVQPHAGESAVDFVARHADTQHRVWVVAPETHGLLGQFQCRVDPARWLGCDGPAIKLASAKRATLLHLADAGITTPLAFEHAPETRRWVVKPDDGAGAIDACVHASADAAWDDWAQRSRSGSAMALEPWVEGEALSLSLLCSTGHTELLSVNRQHLAVGADGLLAYRGVEVNVLPPAGARGMRLAALASRVGRAMPGLRGFVGIDLVWHAQRGPVLIEVNPRLTCAYVGLSQALGRNLAADVIKAHAKEAGHGDA
jgi:tyramine---L-glutamate ligase